MSRAYEIKKAMEQLFTPKSNQLIDCIVTAIDGVGCTIKINGGLELPGVRLRATIADGTDEFIVYPKVGSKALALSVSGDLSDLVLIKADKVEKIVYKQGMVEFELDATTGKVKLTNGAVSLKDLFSQLHDIISQLIVLTPNGPSSGLGPTSVTSLAQFSTAFNNLLYD